MRVDVVDQSNWQPGTDHLKTARRAGVRALVHKATEGATYVDPYYARRRTAVRAYNRRLSVRLRLRRRLVFGGYHFARPGTAAGDATAQARWFLTHAAPKPGDLGPVLDLEVYNGLTTAQLTSWVGEWCGVMRAELGTPGVVYTQHDLGDHHGAWLWVSAYSDADTAPRVPHPWPAWSLWQFSDSKIGTPRRVAGMAGGDLSVLNTGATRGDVDAALARLLIGHPGGQPANLRRTFLGRAVRPLRHARSWARAHGHPKRAGVIGGLLARVRGLIGGRRPHSGT